MTIWPGKSDDPLQLIGVAHDAKADLFRAGEVWNASPSQDVVSYRIGWLIFPKNGDKPIEREGRLLKLKSPLAPDQRVIIPAQNVKPEEGEDGLHNRVVFYIAEAILGDGTDWRPDLSVIEKKYTPPR
jgi:hypothetical protein